MLRSRARRTVAWALSIGLALAGTSDARADGDRSDGAHAEGEPALETANGITDCRTFSEQNARELTAWEAAQPPVPYRYPRERTFLNAPWGNFFTHLGYAGELLLATILPHVGAQYRGGGPAATVSWPWTIFAFGPPYSCTRKPDTFVVHGHRAHRFLVEPALSSSDKGTGFSVRPGYRFILHPTSWVVGPGLGLGATVDIKGQREPFRTSVSPEAVLHFGHCCRPSYVTFALRYDHYFAGNARDIVGGSLGYTFF